MLYLCTNILRRIPHAKYTVVEQRAVIRFVLWSEGVETSEICGSVVNTAWRRRVCTNVWTALSVERRQLWALVTGQLLPSSIITWSTTVCANGYHES